MHPSAVADGMKILPGIFTVHPVYTTVGSGNPRAPSIILEMLKQSKHIVLIVLGV